MNDMRNLNWEYFDDGPVSSPRERIYVTVNRDGRFFLNEKALEALGTPHGVALMYDRREKVIGIRPSQPNRRETHLLRGKHQSTGRVIHAKRFCRRFDIRPSETYAFVNVESIDGPILLLDLNDVHSVSKGATK